MTNATERSKFMRSLFSGVDPEELARTAAPANAAVGSGAVKAMGRAFSAVEAENESLRRQVANAGTVVEIDTALISPSFVRDRLDIEGDPAFSTFVESIRERGQELPILLRPSPDMQGQYQIAYGHRRWRACRLLGRPVKAIVRQLTDDELVVAQGVENAERANLSFIEQAVFAVTLKKRGFSRETIAAALGRGEAKRPNYISMLIALAASLPEGLIEKIGPAPAVGRPSWERLASRFSGGAASPETQRVIDELTASTRWMEEPSDRRFAILLKALEPGAAQQEKPIELDLGGDLVVSVKASRSSTSIIVPQAPLPGLSDWLIEQLPELVREYRNRRETMT